MIPERVFLDWSRPLLPAAAEWLTATDTDERGRGAQRIVVVSGARARRRLVELLALAGAAPGGAPVPELPRIVSLRALPDLIGAFANQSLDDPAPRAVADDLRHRLAVVEALDEMPPEPLQPLIDLRDPSAGAPSDLASRLALAKVLVDLEGELAAEAIGVADVAQHLQQNRRRWRSIVQVLDVADRRLRQAGLISRDRANLEMLRGVASGGDAVAAAGTGLAAVDIVLVGLADLPKLFRCLLDGSPAVSSLTSLVHAPAAGAAMFDDWGGPRPERWRSRVIDYEAFSGCSLRIVGRAAFESAVAADWLAGADGGPSPLHAHGSAIVALSDHRRSRGQSAALLEIGIASHSAVGATVRRSRPGRLIDAFIRYAGSRRLADLAVLLRQPDFEAWLRRQPAGWGSAPARGWLDLLDRYTSESLAVSDRVLPGGGRGPGFCAAVRRLVDRVLEGDGGGDGRRARNGTKIEVTADRSRPEGLGPPGTATRERRLLQGWREAIARVLTEVYGDRNLHPRRDRELIDSLGVIGDGLRDLNALFADTACAEGAAPTWTLGEAMALLRESVWDDPLPGRDVDVGSSDAPPPVEIVGWLEVAADDAPVAVLGGLNEGLLPQSVASDAFLPDKLRRELGLLDDRRRLSRDLFVFEAAIRCRQRVLLLASRTGLEDEPLAPSRLLLARRREQLPEAVLSFYRDAEAQSRVDREAAPSRRAFGVPAPTPPNEPPEAMRVTAFRDYLRCPYRFYLRHIERLEPQRDLPRELDGAVFGSLAHEVLGTFGWSEEAASTDRDRVAEFLQELLRGGTERLFGSDRRHLLPAVAVQIEQLKRRLMTFAVWQAEQVAGGWRIEPAGVECGLSRDLIVDGQTLAVRGRIDRIDRHPEFGLRVIDYKTSDSPSTAAAAHYRKPHGATQPEWHDLQLPLYRFLVEPGDLRRRSKSGATGEQRPGHAPAAGGPSLAGPMQVGYVRLSKKLNEPLWSWLDLDEGRYEAAMKVTFGVVRDVRRGCFWPPGGAQRFDDGYGLVAGDSLVDRFPVSLAEPVSPEEKA